MELHVFSTCGVRAVIVSDEKRNGEWLRHVRINGKSIRTFSSNVWYHVKSRCKINGGCQREIPTYVGCTMSDTFKDFQKFTDWHIGQVGYSVPNYEIDKDLLSKGNKVYSEEFCVLIPQQLNCFLVNNEARRGDYLVGVTFNKREQRFKSAIRVDGVKIHLGYFDDELSAYKAYKIAKEAEALRWYERLISGEFIVDQRVINRLATWSLEG